jgi:MoxR-like ATPase
MFNVLVDYPDEADELEIVRRTTAESLPQVTRTLTAEEIIDLQRIVRRVPVADHVARYALQFTRLTRSDAVDAPSFVRDYVSWGAGPRASQYLVLAAKARAVLHGRYHVTGEDIRAVVAPVLRHRLMTNFNAEAEGIRPDTIVRQLLDVIPPPEERVAARGEAPEIFGSANAG